VKVLDIPVVPQKKSFPPRALFAALGTTVVLAAGVFWILGSARWQATDGEDPGKQLAEEVLASFRGAWVSNGTSGSRFAAWRNRLLRRQEPQKPPVGEHKEQASFR
jgi:hypothetical protein